MGNTDADVEDLKTNLVSQVRDYTKIEILTEHIHFTREVISVSLGGLSVYQLTITKKSLTLQSHAKKKCIYIVAR